MPEGIITKQLWDPFFERFRAKEMQQESCKTAQRYKIDKRLPSCPPCSYSSQSNTVWEHQCCTGLPECCQHPATQPTAQPLPRCSPSTAQHSTRGQFLLVDREDDSEGAQGRSKGLVITWTHRIVTSGSEHWAANCKLGALVCAQSTVEQGLGNFAVSNPCPK